MSKLYTPQHWRDRAEEAISIAEQLQDREARMIMLRSAVGYLRLADIAEERLRTIAKLRRVPE